MRSTRLQRNASHSGGGVAGPAESGGSAGSRRAGRAANASRKRTTAWDVARGESVRNKAAAVADSGAASSAESGAASEAIANAPVNPGLRQRASKAARKVAANDGRHAPSRAPRNTATHQFTRARSIAAQDGAIPLEKQNNSAAIGADLDAGPAPAPEPEQRSQSPRPARRPQKQARRPQTSVQNTEPGDTETITGFPTFDSLKPVLGFLMVPGLIVLGITLTGGHWPKPMLYLLAILMGTYVLASVFKGVELVLAVLLLYLPFSPVYVIPLGPGLNGTNALIALGLLATLIQSREKDVTWFNWKPGSTLVIAYAFITIGSGMTMALQNGGKEYLLGSEFHTYKGWIEQFIVYFIGLSAIRTHAIARRVFFYMCIGSVLVVIYTVPEMLSKQGMSSIEKSRISGPLLQSNEFGGFVAYTLLFTAGLFLAYFRQIKAWLLAPYFLIALKVLISTFSRGAYLALAVGGLIAGYLRGKRFIAAWAFLGISFFVIFPQFLPESIVARLQHSVQKSEATAAGTKLDKSSEHRIVLWKAAGEMIQDNPVMGTGFKGFARYKHLYTEHDVREKDPHNYYLYVASQMGIPALLIFFGILAQGFFKGCRLSKNKDDVYVRAMGMAGAGAVIAYAAVCMFGSRAVSPEFTCYFWVMIACMQVLSAPDKGKVFANQRSKRQARRANIQGVEKRSDKTGGQPTAQPARRTASPTSSGKRRTSAFDIAQQGKTDRHN